MMKWSDTNNLSETLENLLTEYPPDTFTQWAADNADHNVVVLGRMVEHSNIRSLSNFQQMFCFTKYS